MVNCKSQSEHKLQKSNDKNPRVKTVKENITKLPKDIKSLQKKKKVIRERKNDFTVGDSMTKELAERVILKVRNVKIRPLPGCIIENKGSHQGDNKKEA